MPLPPTERHIKEIVSLKRKKGRDEHGMYLVEGLRSLESALLAGAPIQAVYLTPSQAEDRQTQQVLARAAMEWAVVPDKVMAKMSDTSSPSGVLALASMPTPTLKCIACMSKVLVLDGVQDPGNVGTLIRTAAWFGIEAVVAGPGTADYFAPKTVRATMGGLWDVVLERVEHLSGFVATNVRAGVDVRVADMAGVSIEEWKPAGPSMIVIGSEAHGISEDVRTAALGAVTIPGLDQSKA
ncbi:RNA methyltransferase, partial [bacterium]|nr:RNA methyltransferase [bacterium]